MRQPPQGGALRTGNPGNRGGRGKTPSAVRALLLHDLAATAPLAREIAEGTPMQTIRVAVASLAPHVKCATCAGPVTLASPSSGLVEIKVKASAPIGERRAALDFMAKYSIGAVRGVSEESVRDRLNQMLDAIEGLVDRETFVKICRVSEPIWTAGGRA